MSKYIKLEDAIDYECPLNEIWEDCINCPLNNSGIEPCKMGKWLKSLPTIEVSEDNKAYTYCSRCGMRVVMYAPSEVPKQVTGKLGDSVKSTDSTIEADFKEMRSKLASTTEQSSEVGEWVADRKNQGGFTPGGNSVKSCSLCGWIYGAHRIVPDYNYCPNCGAKMKGE